MVAYKNIVFALTTVSAAVIRRDAATVKADLVTVDNDIKKLTSDAGSWSGSVFTALTLDDDVKQIESDLQQAASDASGAMLSDSDAAAIVDYMNSPIQSDISAALQALAAKKSDIDSDGLDSTVAGGLQDLKNDADAFAKALSGIIPSDQQSSLASIMSTIDTELQNAINQYNS